MKMWFTSDYHLGHANILKYCGRTLFMTKEDKEKYNYYITVSEEEQKKFRVSDESLNNMNEEIIKRHNQRVKKDDTVIFLGDFCFKNSKNRGEGINIKAKTWEGRLNGNIIFIRGNHDRNNSVKTRIHSLVLNMDNHYINCVHDPLRADANYETNLVGHVHNNWQIKRIRSGESFTDAINVGVDVWNFYPVTFDEIKSRYMTWLKQNNL